MCYGADVRYRASHIPDFQQFIRIVRDTVKTAPLQMIHEFAGAELQRFKKRILKQEFKSFKEIPLSPAWVARKLRAHRDLRVMLATHHYTNSIKIFTRKGADGATLVYIGFDKRANARNLKGEVIPFKLYKLARVQEYGSAKANVPSRPHWRPHLMEMKQRAVLARKKMVKRMVTTIKGRMRKEMR